MLMSDCPNPTPIPKNRKAQNRMFIRLGPAQRNNEVFLQKDSISFSMSFSFVPLLFQVGFWEYQYY
jgi:hypothetical protein